MLLIDWLLIVATAIGTVSLGAALFLFSRIKRRVLAEVRVANGEYDPGGVRSTLQVRRLMRANMLPAIPDLPREVRLLRAAEVVFFVCLGCVLAVAYWAPSAP